MIEQDIMIKEFEEAYINRNEIPDFNEVFINARFFALASTNLKRLGVLDVAKKMEDRLEDYISLLKRIGFVYEEFGSKKIRKGIGLHSLLTSISNSLDAILKEL